MDRLLFIIRMSWPIILIIIGMSIVVSHPLISVYNVTPRMIATHPTWYVIIGFVMAVVGVSFSLVMIGEGIINSLKGKSR